MGLAVPARVIIKFLEENGYVFLRSKGTSHQIYGKNGVNLSVPVHKGKDVTHGTLDSILEKSEFEISDFKKWLGRK